MTLAEQIDSARVQRVIRLFQKAMLHGVTLDKILGEKSTEADKQPRVLATIILIIEIVAEFGSDGGIGRIPHLRQEMSNIQSYLATLQKFIRHECRELTPHEVLNEIPSILLPIVTKLYHLADCYCQTVLIDKKSFVSTMDRLPRDKPLQIHRLIDKHARGMDEQSDTSLAIFIKQYNDEYFHHLLPIYINLLTSKRSSPENKIRILGYIWIRIYEDIHSGLGLYSSERAQNVRKKFTDSASNSGYAVLRHLFVHAIEHERLNDEFEIFLTTKRQMLLELGIKLVQRVFDDIYSEDHSKTSLLLDQISTFCEETIHKCKLGIDLRVPFSSATLRQVAIEHSHFATSSKYLIKQLRTLQRDFECFFAGLTKEDQRHLFGTSFLKLNPCLQEKYVLIITFIHHFGIYYGSLLKDEIFQVVNEAAKDIGGIDNLDDQLALIRDITIDCIVVRNKSVHLGIESDIMNMAYRIKAEGTFVIDAFCEAVHQLDDGMHVSQTFQQTRAHKP
jgi:hypothetical protein